jgi:hypothetical protein
MAVTTFTFLLGLGKISKQPGATQFAPELAILATLLLRHREEVPRVVA